jgi:hypothetical protein
MAFDVEKPGLSSLVVVVKTLSRVERSHDSAEFEV